MKALKVIFIIILIIVGLFLLIAAFLPSEMHIKESVTIDAQSSVVYKQVNSFNNWDYWSPWDTETYPDMKKYYEGAESGVGSIYKWEGSRTGKGKMEILESIPYESIKLSINFEGSDEGGDVSFTFDEVDGATIVEWGFDYVHYGYPFGRVMAAIMKGAMTQVYKEGLEKLKIYCEALPAIPEISIKNIDAFMAIGVDVTSTMETMGEDMGSAFGQLMGYTMPKKIEMTGPPFAIWYEWETETFTYTCGVPIAINVKVREPLKFLSIDAQKVAAIMHIGPYDQSHITWGYLMEYVNDHGLETAGDPWEQYLTDPATEPDQSKWQTMLYWPVK